LARSKEQLSGVGVPRSDYKADRDQSGVAAEFEILTRGVIVVPESTVPVGARSATAAASMMGLTVTSSCAVSLAGFMSPRGW